ncbi:MAG: thioredoxin family protein [Candidatus Omnitrophica bacterium]|nr:thioredoxin family protein [Candidatus Omnitrophota bacterium]MCM8806366.1 thioredoxin family protein [Candidatus Omnitrophota bacterium]
MEILIVGAGCPKCQAVEKVVKEVVEELKISANVSHLYDVREFPKYKVTITPAIVIDGKVVMAGRVPSKEEVKELLKK